MSDHYDGCQTLQEVDAESIRWRVEEFIPQLRRDQRNFGIVFPAAFVPFSFVVCVGASAPTGNIWFASIMFAIALGFSAWGCRQGRSAWLEYAEWIEKEEAEVAVLRRVYAKLYGPDLKLVKP